LLIAVTRFFRGPHSFESLKKSSFRTSSRAGPRTRRSASWVGAAPPRRGFLDCHLVTGILDETARFPVQIFAPIMLPAIERPAAQYLETLRRT